jgi:hypothetical protein
MRFNENTNGSFELIITVPNEIMIEMYNTWRDDPIAELYPYQSYFSSRGYSAPIHHINARICSNMPIELYRCLLMWGCYAHKGY